MPTVMTEFTVRPFAAVTVADDAADLLNAIGGALDEDPRALGPVVGYDYETGRVAATFQVDLVQERDVLGSNLTSATDEARRAFDRALEFAGVDARTAGVAVVEGDDPELLP